MNSYKKIFALISLVILSYDNLHSQPSHEQLESFIELFPENNLPYSISENELVEVDKTKLNVIPSKFTHFFLDTNSSSHYKNYALCSIELENGKTMIFHMEESKLPLHREVYVTILSKDGFPESSVLFAAYEEGVNEIYTYAIINNDKVIHRTMKSFDRASSKVNIKTEKFRLNTIGEIVAL